MTGQPLSGPAKRPPKRLTLPDGNAIAYHASAGKSPGVVFLGGFASDMTGTKATALEAACRARGRAYLRFDYLGHGESSGAFADGTIGGWAGNAVQVLDALADGPQILVGSSMGGWLMLIAALARPERVSGLVGIAPAPDFTEDIMWKSFSAETKAKIEREGSVLLPSDYGEEPYMITKGLIEDGRRHLLLGETIPLSCPVHLLHGMKDDSVPWETSLRLSAALAAEDITLTLIKNGDHRLSTEPHLSLLCRAVESMAERCAAGPGPEAPARSETMPPDNA